MVQSVLNVTSESFAFASVCTTSIIHLGGFLNADINGYYQISHLAVIMYNDPMNDNEPIHKFSFPFVSVIFVYIIICSSYCIWMIAFIVKFLFSISCYYLTPSGLPLLPLIAEVHRTKGVTALPVL